MTTIADIQSSLLRRGFYEPHNGEPWERNFQAMVTQILAVTEELAELARDARRDRQDAAPMDWERAKVEAADVVIASVCLLSAVAGEQADAVLATKLVADETSGWRHTGQPAPKPERPGAEASEVSVMPAWAGFEGDSESYHYGWDDVRIAPV